MVFYFYAIKSSLFSCHFLHYSDALQVLSHLRSVTHTCKVASTAKTLVPSYHPARHCTIEASGLGPVSHSPESSFHVLISQRVDEGI